MNYKSDKKILVLATMSAGKSTLINALIGHDIFPSSNEACTAKIMTYTSDNSVKNIKATVYGRNNTEYENLKKQDIDALNNNDEFKRVEFYGPIFSDLYKNVKVKFIDTPGVNNSQDIRHEEITYKALEEEDFDTILYVLNATQLGTDDDALLLSKLRDYIDKKTSKDVVFVLNKIDEIDIDLENIENLYQNTMRYIFKNTQIKEPKLVCISSYYAKLIKKQRKCIELTRKENRKLHNFIDYINNQDLKIKKLNNLKYLTHIEDEAEDKLLTEVGIYNLEKYLFDGVNREKTYMSIYTKLDEIKKLRDVTKYCENIKELVEELKGKNLLDNEIREFRYYLKDMSTLNSKEAKILINILEDYEEHPVIFAIIKSLKYANNDEKKKKFMKFDKVLKEIEEEVEIGEKINTEEILDFIIEEIKLNKECEYSYTKSLEDVSENKEKLEQISNFINLVKTKIEEEKFTVAYSKSVTKCSGNTTIIEPNGKVTMLSGSKFEKESIPKFDRPIVDIDDGIALDDTGRVYQWGQFCEPIPSNLPKIKQVASSNNIKIALDEFGIIHNWGQVMFYDVFKNMPKINSKIIQITSNDDGVIALDENGKIYCWGFMSKEIYNIPNNIHQIKKVQIINEKSLFALDKDGNVHFFGDIEGNISVPHMLPMIVDITVSDIGGYCMALDANGKVHQLNQVSRVDSIMYNFKQIQDIKYLTPYGGIDKNCNLHKYVEHIIEFESFSGVKVKIPTQ